MLTVYPALQAALATIHPLPASADIDPSYPSFAPDSDYHDPAETHQNKIQLVEYIGPFFAELATQKSAVWTRGLAKALVDRDTTVSMEPLAIRSRTMSAERPMMDASMAALDALDVVPLNEMTMEGDMDVMDDAQSITLGHSEMGLAVGMTGDMGSLDAGAADAT